MLNTVTIEGFVCNFKTGISVSGVMWTRFSLGFRRKAGVVGYINCVTYNKTADRMDRAGIKNGSNIAISGAIRIDEFTRKDGTKATTPGITVNDFSILYRPKRKFLSENPDKSADAGNSEVDTGSFDGFGLIEENKSANNSINSEFDPFA